MNFKNKLLLILKRPSVIALLLLLLFMATTEYRYGWDDQHLEIPLLKSLINPHLYQGDYYVQSLKKNFSSFFYVILSRLITVDQIPTTYFVLFLLSRYFLFYWTYKLWLLLTKNIKLAVMCSLVFILMVRVPEFLYTTFSHQEFALAIIFGGIYYFFKQRYYLSALLLGIAANFHGLYALFPMSYLGLYLLWQVRKEGIKKLGLSLLIFVTASLPFFIWAINKRFTVSAYPVLPNLGWKSLYALACPQNFMFPPMINTSNIFKSFPVFFEVTKEYLLLIILFLINFCFNSDFRYNKRALAFSYGAFIMLALCFVFTFLHPVRLFLDLNIIRNTQYLSFLLMGFTTILIVRTIDAENILIGLGTALLFAMFKYGPSVWVYSSSLLFLLFSYIHLSKRTSGAKRALIGALLTIISIPIIIKIVIIFKNASMNPKVLFNLALTLVFLPVVTVVYLAFKDRGKKRLIKGLLYILPMFVFFYQFTSYYVKRLKMYASPTGFWELQSSWEDMQRYVRDNTPQNSLLMVPYDMEMGGFRILSERKIIASYRDCGIVGFDYGAANEWVRRINDIQAFKVQIKGPIKDALRNAVEKYRVNYIVFMRYAEPKEDFKLLQKVYMNNDFVLYKVLVNPVEKLK